VKLRGIRRFRFSKSSTLEPRFPRGEPGTFGFLMGLEVELKQLFSKFWSDESGATAIEYGLIAAGISLAIIAVVNGLGTNLNEKFTSVNSSLK